MVNNGRYKTLHTPLLYSGNVDTMTMDKPKQSKYTLSDVSKYFTLFNWKVVPLATEVSSYWPFFEDTSATQHTLWSAFVFQEEYLEQPFLLPV